MFLAKSDRYGKATLAEHTEHVLYAIDNIYLPHHGHALDTVHKKMLRVIALSHDIGKAIPEFQKKLKRDHLDSTEEDISRLHHIISPLFINMSYAIEYILDGIELNGRRKDYVGNITKIIITAIVNHHNKDTEKTRHSQIFKSYLYKLLSQKGPVEGIVEELRNHMHHLMCKYGMRRDIIGFNRELAESLAYDGCNLFIDWTFDLDWPGLIDECSNVIILSGALKNADHLASYCEKNNIDLGHIHEQVSLLDTETCYQKVLEYLYGKGASNLWQTKYIDPGSNEHILLIAPTGQGKTEAALIAGAGKKILFLLPLQAATEQIYQRIAQIFGRDKVGIVHSNVLSSLHKMREANNDYAESIDKQIYLSRNLTYPFVIATADQMVTSVLRYPGYDKIYSVIPKSHIVIDEIQFYSPLSMAVITLFVKDVIKTGGQLFIMTATMPEYFKREIMKYARFKIIDLYEINKEKLQKLIKHKISIIYDNDRDYISKAIKLAKNNNKVLIIVNTVREAQYIYKKIEQEVDENMKDSVYLLHSRFTVNHRQRIERTMMKEFANTPDSDKKGKILVATQVAEVSLDIDADYIFTEIAPIDALVQRMGRVLRRYKDTSPEIKEPNVFIVINDKLHSGNNPKHPVYDNEIILITIRILLEKAGVKVDNPSEYTFIETIKKHNGSLITALSEYDKYQLVNALYDELMQNRSRYYEEYMDYIKKLGYITTDSKAKAQDIFRDIDNETVIAENLIDAFMNKLSELYASDQLQYVNFKIYLEDEFFVSVPKRNEKQNNQKDTGSKGSKKYLKDIIKDSIKISIEDQGVFNRIMTWIHDIRVYGHYDEELGFIR